MEAKAIKARKSKADIWLRDNPFKEGVSIPSDKFIVVSQEMINDFAGVTRDNQWIHVNPECAKKSPFKSTIAHGFLLVSLTTHLSDIVGDNSLYSDSCFIVNQGINNVEFLSPVRAGDTLITRDKHLSIEKYGKRSVDILREVNLIIKDTAVHAMRLEIRFRLYFK